LHDLKVITNGVRRIPPAIYEANLRELVRRLRTTEAKLIWASTTPVPAPTSKLGSIADDVPVYNAAAKKVMDENGVAIDPLYEFILPHCAKVQKPQNVHFTEEGYELLATQVAASIEAALPKTVSEKNAGAQGKKPDP
jgi:acyl-CoA thioesterase-1